MLVQTISWFLHGDTHVPLIYSTKIDHHIDEIKKVKTKKISNDDMMVHF